METARELEDKSFRNWRSNTTFINLLPKGGEAEETTDYGPIILGCTYKIKAKALETGLEKALMVIISKYPRAVVEARSIYGRILVTDELIENRKRWGEAVLVYELDFI